MHIFVWDMDSINLLLNILTIHGMYSIYLDNFVLIKSAVLIYYDF